MSSSLGPPIDEATLSFARRVVLASKATPHPALNDALNSFVMAFYRWNPKRLLDIKPTNKPVIDFLFSSDIASTPSITAQSAQSQIIQLRQAIYRIVHDWIQRWNQGSLKSDELLSIKELLQTDTWDTYQDFNSIHGDFLFRAHVNSFRYRHEMFANKQGRDFLVPTVQDVQRRITELNVQEKHMKEKDELMAKIKYLEAAMEQAKRDKEKERDRVKALERTLHFLPLDLKWITNHRNELKVEVERLTNQCRHLEKVESKCQTLSAEIDQYRTLVDEARADKSKMDELFLNAEVERKKSEQLQRDVTLLQSALDATTQRRDSLEAELNTVKNLFEDLQNQTQQYKALESKYAKLTSDVAQFRSLADTLTMENIAEKELSFIQLQNLQQKLDKSESIERALQIHLETWQHTSSEQISTYEDEMTQLRLSHGLLQAQIDKSSNERDGLMQQIRQLQEGENIRSDLVNQLEQQNRDLVAAVEEAKQLSEVARSAMPLQPQQPETRESSSLHATNQPQAAEITNPSARQMPTQPQQQVETTQALTPDALLSPTNSRCTIHVGSDVTLNGVPVPIVLPRVSPIPLQTTHPSPPFTLARPTTTQVHSTTTQASANGLTFTIDSGANLAGVYMFQFGSSSTAPQPTRTFMVEPATTNDTLVNEASVPHASNGPVDLALEEVIRRSRNDVPRLSESDENEISVALATDDVVTTETPNVAMEPNIGSSSTAPQATRSFMVEPATVNATLVTETSVPPASNGSEDLALEEVIRRSLIDKPGLSESDGREMSIVRSNDDVASTESPNIVVEHDINVNADHMHDEMTNFRKDTSFASQAIGSGEVAEFVGKTLDRMSEAIDELKSDDIDKGDLIFDCDLVQQDGEYDSDDVSSDSTINDGKQEDAASANSWLVVEEKEHDVVEDGGLGRAAEAIGSALFQSDLMHSIEGRSVAISSVTTVPTVAPSIDVAEQSLSSVQLQRWAIQLEQLHELGFMNDAACIDALESLSAANIGVDFVDEVTVEQVIQLMLGD